VSSSEAFETMTGIVQDLVFTHFRSFTARITRTFIDIVLTISAIKSSFCTITFEIIDQINTLASIKTWKEHAIVDIMITFVSIKTWQTFAFEGTDQIETSRTIHTWIRCAFIDVYLALIAFIANRTNTPKLCHFVNTSGAIQTRM
jgi:hypothetical protein